MSFVIKHRGAPPQGRARADYHCEKHGRFTTEVDRNEHGDLPDTIPCQHELVEDYFPGDPPALCGKPSVWCISAPLARVNPIEAVKGKSQKPEFKTWTDTRAIGEGQPLYEWREDRAKIWEEKRKEDVMRFAREVNERPIGGD